MVNKEMFGLGSNRSVIRELFEFGKQRAAEVGADKVFDFSLGNPNVEGPKELRRAISELASADFNTVHGYTSAQGDASVRAAIANDLNSRFGAGVSADNIYMTCGAAASLTITIRALNEGEDEFIIFAPYFPEYKVFIRSMGAIPVTVPISEKDFQINFDALNTAISSKTKAVIINSPNNPSGAVYSENTVKRLASLLKAKSKEYGRPIVLISDEPYRELVYDGASVPYVMNYYDDSIVCYSYSKSLSLPGERIGYIAVSPKLEHSREVYLAICGAGRALGYVCAPSMFQLAAVKCIGARPNVAAYKKNRDLLYNSLMAIGYNCVRPDGAFYLFVKSPEPDATAFAERAKKYGLLIVPGDDFGAPGYVRIAYCVNYDMIERSIPAFKALFAEYEEVRAKWEP